MVRARVVGLELIRSRVGSVRRFNICRVSLGFIGLHLGWFARLGVVRRTICCSISHSSLSNQGSVAPLVGAQSC